MGESVFEVVKQSVTVREAAELYGIAVGRGGMACCPFHDDRHPSMKVDTRFHCFGCGADGDVIDFTARLYGLSPKEAAEKLAQDFGLAYDSKAPPRRNYVRQKSEAQARKEKREHGWRVLTDYYHLLRKWEADYSPKTPDEDPHPRFLEAIQKKDYMGYLLDTLLDSSTEEQDQWIAEHTAEISAIGRRVNIMADKPTNRERLQQITAGIEQGIKELFESEKYMRYLSVMSRFHRYSVNNTMLIYMQKPDATLVAGYNKWKNQFERHVKKGEHGITIIAPTPFKKKIEEQKLDPDTKAPILDAEGKAVMEEREVEIPMFRPVKVFDVSQTDGKPLPELASTLSGSVQNYEAFMEALRRSAPVPLSVEPMAANMDGYFSPDQQRIAIRAGMSEVQTVSAAVHEIAHSKLHNYAKAQEEAARAGDKEPPKKKDRNTEEVEAESISYAVCQYYGIQTGENSFGYIANWSQGKELPELRASLETINKTAGELINDIDRHYKVICKERGIDLTAAPEPQLDPIEQLAADIDQFSFDYDTYEYRDQVDNREDALRELTATLRSGDASGVRDWLQEFADENEPGEAVTKAAELLDRLDQLVPEPDPNLVKMADEARAMGVDTAWNSDKEFPVSFDTERTQPSAEAQEALLLVDDATYLHVQSCDTGWDYTLYDAATMKQLDGGQLDAPELSLSTAALKICEMRGMGGQSIRYAPLSMIETLQEAAIQQMQAAAQAAVPEVTQLPDAPEQALDEYPMPDPALTQDDLEKCGYLDSDLLPLSKERAYELMAQDLTVYMVQQGENPAMAFDTADLDAHDGIFAVTREEWEDSPSFDAQVMDRMDHQQEREQAFLNHKGDCYAIYQVKHTDELRDIRYEGLEWVKSIGRTVQRDNYDLVYTAPLTPGDLKGSVLDNLEYRFNNEHPADYRHPSMSVSDIVAIKQDGKVSCHYCDSFGFQQIPGFLPDNPLKSAEMTVEDDYGMIDGVINNGTKEPTVAQLEQQARSGQPISLMDLAAAAHREDRDKKKSVMDQLKSQPKSEHKKTAPKKSAEREI
ncbi:LPD16 domain-containing protein [Anaerotignum lactatifermentans]|uniref:CHC2 zinc finger n=1 Tax=Anaerotignum lactatifermentans DSM 14214 TaxID=1121323 RepID=A0A1M6P959_9FIRM|nr:LPD16 domain-containing protein [Anaerotignum lactatifermentans]SHK04430.1 CHC2 zinc finger [[Clostridium] lactatifermentans DSM 14214] [Anaerotignum lactatifermentans DSM 14214]